MIAAPMSSTALPISGLAGGSNLIWKASGGIHDAIARRDAGALLLHDRPAADIQASNSFGPRTISSTDGPRPIRFVNHVESGTSPIVLMFGEVGGRRASRTCSAKSCPLLPSIGAARLASRARSSSNWIGSSARQRGAVIAGDRQDADCRQHADQGPEWARPENMTVPQHEVLAAAASASMRRKTPFSVPKRNRCRSRTQILEPQRFQSGRHLAGVVENGTVEGGENLPAVRLEEQALSSRKR
jgi:hypothetical protein